MRDIAMNAKISFVGLVFGRLTVVKEHPERKREQRAWECRCECGNDVVVVSYDLKTKNTQSCGCLQKERASKVHRTHGLGRSREYSSWNGMLRRCGNKTADNYERYGGRGISVCDRWKSFENFLADMGKCPDGYSIDRTNNDGDYEPGNCQWVSSLTQAKNKRTPVHNVSGHKGVFWCTSNGLNKWAAQITRNHKTHHLGYFEKLENAVAARKAAEQFFDSRSLSDISNEAKPSAC